MGAPASGRDRVPAQVAAGVVEVEGARVTAPALASVRVQRREPVPQALAQPLAPPARAQAARVPAADRHRRAKESSCRS